MRVRAGVAKKLVLLTMSVVQWTTCPSAGKVEAVRYTLQTDESYGQWPCPLVGKFIHPCKDTFNHFEM